MPFYKSISLLTLWLLAPACSCGQPNLPPPPPPPPPVYESPAAMPTSPFAAYIKQGHALGMPTDALLLIVDVGRQQLTVLEAQNGDIRGQFVISTARAGVGNSEGSKRTPLGWHKIDERIGATSPPGEVFVARISQNSPLKPHEWRNPASGDYVLTRIMWLRGLEPGINAGPGIDSHERYIYLHGTNQEQLLGQPASDGCIRMSNRDVMELFDWVGQRETWCLIVSYL